MSEEKKLFTEYVDARSTVDLLKEQLSDAQKYLRESEQNLRRYMEDNGVESTSKYEDLGRFSLGSPIINVAFDKENYPIDYALNWCKENGFADAVKESVHHATLGSLVRSIIDEGKEVPYFFKISTYRPSNFQKG
jgi:hypothetical protein